MESSLSRVGVFSLNGNNLIEKNSRLFLYVKKIPKYPTARRIEPKELKSKPIKFNHIESFPVKR
jgi:hypothetical protein